jgi:ABC-type multidrug transport system fused ATPase/permease subunit
MENPLVAQEVLGGYNWYDLILMGVFTVIGLAGAVGLGCYIWNQYTKDPSAPPISDFIDGITNEFLWAQLYNPSLIFLMLLVVAAIVTLLKIYTKKPF